MFYFGSFTATKHVSFTSSHTIVWRKLSVVIVHKINFEFWQDISTSASRNTKKCSFRKCPLPVLASKPLKLFGPNSHQTCVLSPSPTMCYLFQNVKGETVRFTTGYEMKYLQYVYTEYCLLLKVQHQQHNVFNKNKQKISSKLK